MSTLFLDTNTWDIVADASGNIAVAQDPYATAQQVACAVKMFLGEYWYDTTLGVPYFTQVLGKTSSIQLIKAQIVQAALTVKAVVSAQCFLSSVSNRQISGQIQFTTTGNSNTQTVAF